MWGGFLAGWPGLPNNEYHASYLARIQFGIAIALKFPPKVAAIFVGYLAKFTAEYGPLILRSIFTPVFEIGSGAPPPDPGLRARRQQRRDVYVTGDAAAKQTYHLLGPARAASTSLAPVATPATSATSQSDRRSATVWETAS